MNLYFFVATRLLFLTDMSICMYTVCQVIPLSIDDSIASPDDCSIACVAGPWLFFLGFTTSFGKLHKMKELSDQIFVYLLAF